MPPTNSLAAYFPAAQGLTRAVPGSQLMSPDDYTQLPLEPASGTAPVDPYVANAVLQDRLKSEFEDRLFNAQRTGDVGSVAALQTALGRIGQDQASGPLAQQRQQVNAWNNAQQNAIAQGFRGGVPTQDANGVWGTVSPDPTALQTQAQTAAAAMKTQMPFLQAQAVQQAETERERLKEASTAAREEATRKAEQQRTSNIMSWLGNHPDLKVTDVNPKTGEMKFATPMQSGTVLKMPAGQQGVKLQQEISRYNQLKNQSPLGSAYHAITGFLGGSSVDAEQKQLEGDFDLQIPGWRNHLLPNGQLVTGVTPTNSGTVRMRAPNGQEMPVSADQVDHYKSLGATVVE